MAYCLATLLWHYLNPCLAINQYQYAFFLMFFVWIIKVYLKVMLSKWQPHIPGTSENWHDETRVCSSGPSVLINTACTVNSCYIMVEYEKMKCIKQNNKKGWFWTKVWRHKILIKSSKQTSHILPSQAIYGVAILSILTHGGLVMPYDDIDLGQQWLR